MFRFNFSGAAALVAGSLLYASSSFALSPELIKEVGFTGEPFAVSTDQVSGEIIVWTIEAGEVVTYDEDGIKIADCTAGLGLANFSTNPFDETRPGDNTGSRVTRVSGSIASIVNYDAELELDNSSNSTFVINCNNPSVKITYPSNFQVRFASSAEAALGSELITLGNGTIPEPSIYTNGNIQNLSDSQVDFWVPIVGDPALNIIAGFGFNSAIGTASPYLFETGFLGNGEGSVQKITASPFSPSSNSTVIYTDGGFTKYYLVNSGTFGEFLGYDIKDSTRLAFLISNSSECLLVQDASEISGSTSLGNSCIDSEASGTLVYVITDSTLKILETNPIVVPPLINDECIDEDGDGYGWNGSATCFPEGINPNDRNDDNINNEDGDNNQPGLEPCIDEDGDGYGWNGSATCFPNGEDPNPPVIVDNTVVGDQNLLCVDNDGDGWGWNGFESCRPPTPDGEERDLVCIDSDGDGWGWDGSQSCIP